MPLSARHANRCEHYWMNDDRDHARRVNQARDALDQSDLPPRLWAVDELVDDRCCPLRIGGGWTAGYFERGTLSIKFQETHTDVAIQRFVAWVSQL